jgi:hypothetical protein
MIQARRNGGQSPPNWTEVDEAAVQSPPPPPEGEDPIEVFGKYLLGKSKGLWRKVSPKPPTQTAVVIGELVSEKENPGVGTRLKRLNASDPELHQNLHTLVQADEASGPTTSAGDEGGVWEDEIGDNFRMRIQRAKSAPTDPKTAEQRAKRSSLADRNSLADIST